MEATNAKACLKLATSHGHSDACEKKQKNCWTSLSLSLSLSLSQTQRDDACPTQKHGLSIYSGYIHVKPLFQVALAGQYATGFCHSPISTFKPLCKNMLTAFPKGIDRFEELDITRLMPYNSTTVISVGFPFGFHFLSVQKVPLKHKARSSPIVLLEALKAGSPKQRAPAVELRI